MSTIIILKGVDPADYIIEEEVEIRSTVKSKFEIIKPGEIEYISQSGGVTRVLKRGNIFNNDGSPYDADCGKPCWWHRHHFDGLAMGIPIKIVNNNIYMDGFFCSYSCAYACLIEELEKMPTKRNPMYSKSLLLIRNLHRIEFPKEKLIKAQDWRLLKDVGNGNLSVKDFLIGLKGIRTTRKPNIKFGYIGVTIHYEIDQH